MNKPRKIYWDSSCFICLLNRTPVDEARREICEDVLHHARSNAIILRTSTWTIAEVIRPRMSISKPLPAWADQAIAAIEKEYPEARKELELLWSRHQSSTLTYKLTDEQIEIIQAMFEWDYLELVNLDQRFAEKAVEISRNYGLKAPDAVHAASAILSGCDVLQRWDRDFNKIASLISVEDPVRLSDPTLFDALKAGQVATAKQEAIDEFPDHLELPSEQATSEAGTTSDEVAAVISETNDSAPRVEPEMSVKDKPVVPTSKQEEDQNAES